MDPVTQGLLGASLAGSLSKKKQTRAAIFAGTIGGLFPDFDILIKSNIDPLLAIEYHRNFSHSLVFIPFGGLVVTFFFYSCFLEQDYPSDISIFSQHLEF